MKRQISDKQKKSYKQILAIRDYYKRKERYNMTKATRMTKTLSESIARDIVRASFHEKVKNTLLQFPVVYDEVINSLIPKEDLELFNIARNKGWLSPAGDLKCSNSSGFMMWVHKQRSNNIGGLWFQIPEVHEDMMEDKFVPHNLKHTILTIEDTLWQKAKELGDEFSSLNADIYSMTDEVSCKLRAFTTLQKAAETWVEAAPFIEKYYNISSGSLAVQSFEDLNEKLGLPI